MHSIARPAAATALFLCIGSPAMADGDDWKSKMGELQRAERLVKASLAVRDRAEMARQSEVQHEIFMWAAKRTDKSSMQACLGAIGAFGSFMRTMFGEDKAATYVERYDYLTNFRTKMASCESQLGIPTTPAPNLREGAV